jgi:hypothetical protein
MLTLRLSALSERSTRLAWLAHWLEHNEPSAVSGELEALLVAAESRSEPAILGIVSFVQWVSGAVNPARMHALRDHVQHTTFGHLTQLLQHAPDCPLEFRDDHRSPPKQGIERPLTLGERKNLARRSGRKGLARLLRDPHPAVLEQLLYNPLLTEADVVRLVTLRPPCVTGVCALVKDGRWLLAPRVRMGLLQNPDLPPWQTLPLLWLCSRTELGQLALGTNLPSTLLSTAAELVVRRSPLSTRPPHDPVN